jgi:hypothetical protein
VFAIDLEIQDFYLTFAQIQSHKDAKTGSSKPLRILRFALTKLPTIESIPLVSKLEQPFDQLGFIWLNQDLNEDAATILNANIFSPNEPLLWKNSKSSPKDSSVAATTTQGEMGASTTKVADKISSVVLPAGSQFQVVVEYKQTPTVILDYTFGKAAKSQASTPASTPTSTAALTNGQSNGSTTTVEKEVVKADATKEPVKTSSASKGDAPSTMTPMAKKQGPLTISNISLKYSGGKLHVLLDATVSLGPLEFDLIGFSIILDLSKFSIHDWRSIKIDFSLEGLGVQVKEGKFILAGLFERIKSDTQTGFAGGLSIDVSPYGFLAAGAYIENSDGFKTVFAFAMLTGPLMEFGWAEVRGITGGFGYNSNLRLPDITQVAEFPLLSHSASKDKDPLAQLKGLSQSSGSDAWITARDKTIWVAAGKC